MVLGRFRKLKKELNLLVNLQAVDCQCFFCFLEVQEHLKDFADILTLLLWIY
jgi:hypothetical protein